MMTMMTVATMFILLFECALSGIYHIHFHAMFMCNIATAICSLFVTSNAQLSYQELCLWTPLRAPPQTPRPNSTFAPNLQLR